MIFNDRIDDLTFAQIARDRLPRLTAIDALEQVWPEVAVLVVVK